MRTLRRLLGWCLALSIVFAAVPLTSNVAAVLAGMVLAMFAAAGFVVLSVAYATHIYASDHAGLIAGVGAGSWSLAVAIAMPLFGRLFDLRHYATAFWLAGAFPIAGYFGWLLLSSRRSPAGFPLPRQAGN